MTSASQRPSVSMCDVSVCECVFIYRQSDRSPHTSAAPTVPSELRYVSFMLQKINKDAC